MYILLRFVLVAMKRSISMSHVDVFSMHGGATAADLLLAFLTS